MFKGIFGGKKDAPAAPASGAPTANVGVLGGEDVDVDKIMHGVNHLLTMDPEADLGHDDFDVALEDGDDDDLDQELKDAGWISDDDHTAPPAKAPAPSTQPTAAAAPAHPAPATAKPAPAPVIALAPALTPAQAPIPVAKQPAPAQPAPIPPNVTALAPNKPQPQEHPTSNQPPDEIMRLKLQALELSRAGEKEKAAAVLRRIRALQAETTPGLTRQPSTGTMYSLAESRVNEYKRAAVAFKQVDKQKALVLLQHAKELETRLEAAKSQGAPLANIPPPPPMPGAQPAQQQAAAAASAANKPAPKVAHDTKAAAGVLPLRIGDNEVEVNVIEATHLVSPSKASGMDTYVVLMWDEERLQTQTIKDSLNPMYNFSKRINIDRYSRTTLRLFQKKKLDFEIWKKGGFLRSDELLVRAPMPLTALLETAEINQYLETYSPEKQRHPTGAKLHVQIRLSKPLSDPASTANTRTTQPAKPQQAHAPQAAPARQAAPQQQQQQHPQKKPAAPAASATTSSSAAATVGGPKKVSSASPHTAPAPDDDEPDSLFDDTLENVNRLISFDGLTWEEEYLKGLAATAGPFADEVSDRLLQIQTRKTIIQMQVESEKLSFEQYLELATKQMENEKNLAIQANKFGTNKGKQVAVRALQRYKVIKQEVDNAIANKDELQ